jgi:hypothetical protein
MVWVFGIVFLTIVAILSYWLYVKSVENRILLSKITRKNRIICGVLAGLLSFASAYLALIVATSIADWNHATVISLVGTLLFMLLFVSLQVGAMMCFVSIAIESETKNDHKRS